MATTPQASPGYSKTITPQMDSASPNLNKSPIAPAPPTISSGAPRFPPPILQQDQIPSHSVKNPTMLSPANGIKTGSSIPHLSTPPNLQQDQIHSHSIKNPTMPSPANGVKTGSPIPHLSTPPGPPVFTSPIRPAAVPFRTSAATPQSVAFSSGSSLPTSSPPNFSNGSVELQQQLPSAIEESVPDGNSPCVLFSAHKVSFILCGMK